VRLLDVAPSQRNDPRARLYIVDHVAPGEAIKRRIEVVNTTSAVAHVALYPAAAAISDGVFSVADGHTPNDLSTWTSVTPGAIDVPAGGRVTAAVTVRVPLDAAPGEQYGAVWAEVSSAPTSPDGVIQINRVGVRMYVSAGPGGAPAADFTIDSLTAKRLPDGRPVVEAAVHNTGGRALDMSGTLQLVDEAGGLNAGPYPAKLGVTLAVAATEPVTIVLDEKLPAGPWDAAITLRSGLIERTVRAVVTFPTLGAAKPVLPTTSDPRSLAPIVVALVGLLLSLVAGAALLRWRFRRGIEV